MMRTLTRSTLLITPLALLIGCGGGDQETASSTPTTVAATATTVPAPTGTTELGEFDEEDIPVLVWADANPEEGKAPLTVQFTAETEGGKPPFKFTWNFGDGSPVSNEQNPKHTYEKAGMYRADLDVTDAVDDEDSDYMEIEVQ